MSFKEGCDMCGYNYEYGWLEALRASLGDLISSPEIETALKLLTTRIHRQVDCVERELSQHEN